jgi:hypothetical protein
MAEIRLRDVAPDFIKRLEFIQKELKEKTATGAIEALVNGYTSAQSHLKQLAARNSELHKRLQVYFDQESNVKNNLTDYQIELINQQRFVKQLLKGIGKRSGTKKARPRK